MKRRELLAGDSYLDIRGADNVVDAVKRCWASLWTARCAYYRHRLGMSALLGRLSIDVFPIHEPI